jgi:hypothetical protein
MSMYENDADKVNFVLKYMCIYIYIYIYIYILKWHVSLVTLNKNIFTVTPFFHSLFK